jgi:hypothetical protein
MIAVAMIAPISTETNSGASALAAGAPPDLFPAALQEAVQTAQAARPQVSRSSDRSGSSVERQVQEAQVQAGTTEAGIDSTQLRQAMAASAGTPGVPDVPGGQEAPKVPSEPREAREPQMTAVVARPSSAAASALPPPLPEALGAAAQPQGTAPARPQQLGEAGWSQQSLASNRSPDGTAATGPQQQAPVAVVARPTRLETGDSSYAGTTAKAVVKATLRHDAEDSLPRLATTRHGGAAGTTASELSPATATHPGGLGTTTTNGASDATPQAVIQPNLAPTQAAATPAATATATAKATVTTATTTDAMPAGGAQHMAGSATATAARLGPPGAARQGSAAFSAALAAASDDTAGVATGAAPTTATPAAVTAAAVHQVAAAVSGATAAGMDLAAAAASATLGSTGGATGQMHTSSAGTANTAGGTMTAAGGERDDSDLDDCDDSDDSGDSRRGRSCWLRRSAHAHLDRDDARGRTRTWRRGLGEGASCSRRRRYRGLALGQLACGREPAAGAAAGAQRLSGQRADSCARGGDCKRSSGRCRKLRLGRREQHAACRQRDHGAGRAAARSGNPGPWTRLRTGQQTGRRTESYGGRTDAALVRGVRSGRDRGDDRDCRDRSNRPSLSSRGFDAPKARAFSYSRGFLGNPTALLQVNCQRRLAERSGLVGQSGSRRAESRAASAQITIQIVGQRHWSSATARATAKGHSRSFVKVI